MNKIQNKQRFSKFEIILSVLLILALSVIAVLLVTYPKNSISNDSTAKSGVFVNLNAIRFDVSSGKLVKRTDTGIVKLESFLNKTGEKDLELGCQSVYYNAMFESKDKKQVLFAYGCEYPGARMFAVEKDGEWNFISPTNQFDEFSIPLCNYVDKYDIDRTIAPVCHNASTLQDTTFDYLNR